MANTSRLAESNERVAAAFERVAAALEAIGKTWGESLSLKPSGASDMASTVLRDGDSDK